MKSKTGLKKTGLLLLPICLVIGLRLWALSGQTPHLEKIALEIGSIPQYRVGIYPNHSGSNLLFFQETETGLGTFFCETATGKTRLLYDEKEKGYLGRFRLLGWSADDRILAFATMSDSGATNGSGAINICKGDTGEVINSIPAEGYAGDSQFAWLSARSFVYSTFSHRSWLLYAEKPDGSWAQTQVVKRFTDGRLTNLTATSSHSIAWQDKQAVWTYDFARGAMSKVWEATTNQLTGLAFSDKSGNLLFKCKDVAGALLLEFRLPNSLDATGGIVNMTRQIPNPPRADLDMGLGRFNFKIRTTPEAAEVKFAWDGMLRYYGLGGNGLFFTGNRLNGVPGIWQFDTKSESVRQVASAINTPLKWAKNVEPATGVFTNKAGIQISYHLWQSAHVVPGKKYPLVVGQALNVWNPFQQVAAHAGWFYATTDLTNWINNTSTWSEDVAGLCGTLPTSFAIDTSKVCFIAYSAQADDALRLFKEKPGMASGMVLFHPAGFSLSDMPVKQLLLFGGTDDKNSPADHLIKLQDAAVNAGISVRFLLQDGVQHLTRSIAAEREQSLQFGRFLSENK